MPKNSAPEFNGWRALDRALDFLDIHLIILIIIAFIFTILLATVNSGEDWGRRPLHWLHVVMRDFSYILFFSMFGVSTAFFLSLGLKRAENGESSNGLLEAFSAPFISLLTAGTVYMASKNGRNADKPERVAIGVACFLFSAIVSYRTFFYQILTAF